MSFGFSVGDIITVIKLGRTVFDKFRNSDDRFDAIALE